MRQLYHHRQTCPPLSFAHVVSLLVVFLFIVVTVLPLLSRYPRHAAAFPLSTPPPGPGPGPQLEQSLYLDSPDPDPDPDPSVLAADRPAVAGQVRLLLDPPWDPVLVPDDKPHPRSSRSSSSITTSTTMTAYTTTNNLLQLPTVYSRPTATVTSTSTSTGSGSTAGRSSTTTADATESTASLETPSSTDPSSAAAHHRLVARTRYPLGVQTAFPKFEVAHYASTPDRDYWEWKTDHGLGAKYPDMFMYIRVTTAESQGGSHDTKPLQLALAQIQLRLRESLENPINLRQRPASGRSEPFEVGDKETTFVLKVSRMHDKHQLSWQHYLKVIELDLQAWVGYVAAYNDAVEQGNAPGPMRRVGPLEFGWRCDRQPGGKKYFAPNKSFMLAAGSLAKDERFQFPHGSTWVEPDESWRTDPEKLVGHESEYAGWRPGTPQQPP